DAIRRSAHAEVPQDRCGLERRAAAALLHREYGGADDPQAAHRRDGPHARGRGRLTAYYLGRDSRAAWRPDMPAILAQAIGIDPRRTPRDEEMARLFEAKRADTGEAWSRHQRKLSGLDLVFSPHKSVSLAAEFASSP